MNTADPIQTNKKRNMPPAYSAILSFRNIPTLALSKSGYGSKLMTSSQPAITSSPAYILFIFKFIVALVFLFVNKNAKLIKHQKNYSKFCNYHKKILNILAYCILFCDNTRKISKFFVYFSYYFLWIQDNL